MRAAFDRRRRTIYKMLSGIEGVTCVEPEGAFYAFPSFEGVLGRELRGRRPATTLELAELVLEESRVAFVPGEAFGAPGYGRFSYALSDADLVRGIERIGELFAELGDRHDSRWRRILVTERLSPRGLELMAAAGHEVDVRLSLTPDELLEAVAGAAALVIRSATRVTARGARGRPRPCRRRAGRHRARQRRRRGGDPARSHGRQRSGVEHPVGRRARRRPPARPGAQHPPGPRRARRGALGAREVGGRRAARQDARDRRARPGGHARRPARGRVRDAAHRL